MVRKRQAHSTVRKSKRTRRTSLESSESNPLAGAEGEGSSVQSHSPGDQDDSPADSSTQQVTGTANLSDSSPPVSSEQHTPTGTSKSTESTLEPNTETNESVGLSQDSSQQQQLSGTVEVIDVDKLPDVPDSPIGDDVIEIYVPPPTEEQKESSSSTTSTHCQYVDLTDLSDHSPTNEQQQNEDFPVRPREENGNESDDKEEDNLSPALFTSKETLVATTSSRDAKDPATSIMCPVCQDDLNQIKKDSRKLMSTVCGHIFCNECVAQAVETQRKCPTCRRKLKKTQFHPIFI